MSLLFHVLLNISRFVPLSIRPESSTRKSKISAMSPGVMPACKCGAAWRSISVSTAPGLTAHTRILYGLPSTARISVNPATPAFDTLYALRPGNFSTPFTPESEEKLTITPERCSAMIRKASRQHKNVPRRFTASTRSQVDTSISTREVKRLFPRNSQEYRRVHRPAWPVEKEHAHLLRERHRPRWTTRGILRVQSQRRPRLKG